jgi:hypothetical protein
MGYELDDRGSIADKGNYEISSIIHQVKTGSEVHSASYPIVTGNLSPAVERGWGVKLTPHLHLLPR